VNRSVYISNVVLFTFCQPYHLFEPFLDMSLPIAFEDELEKAVSVRNVVFFTHTIMYDTMTE